MCEELICIRKEIHGWREQTSWIDMFFFNLVFVGGFYNVYQGQLEDGTKVVVKNGDPRSEQGLMSFIESLDGATSL